MSNRLRRVLAVIVTTFVFSAALTSPVLAQTRSEADAANAPVAVDALILRPAGLLSLVVGTGLFLVVAPIVLVTRPHEIGKPFDSLVAGPARYVWVDPLGAH